ncbi:hypothetical protein HCB82_05175 [Paenibacillus sp. 7028]|nr:hypothetical protein [Paenibacillus apii]
MAKFYYHAWTSEEDKLLTEIMVNGVVERKKVLDLFNEASDRLQRTAKSCQNRWYELRSARNSKAV